MLLDFTRSFLFYSFFILPCASNIENMCFFINNTIIYMAESLTRGRRGEVGRHLAINATVLGSINTRQNDYTEIFLLLCSGKKERR